MFPFSFKSGRRSQILVRTTLESRITGLVSLFCMTISERGVVEELILQLLRDERDLHKIFTYESFKVMVQITLNIMFKPHHFLKRLFARLKSTYDCDTETANISEREIYNIVLILA